MQAKIEIYSRPIKLIEPIMGQKGPQHLYIIHTDSNGYKTALRGGTETSDELSMLVDNLYITNSEYKPGHPDWYANPYISVIEEGIDSEVQKLVNKMWEKAQEINKGNYDYKLPTNIITDTLIDSLGNPHNLYLSDIENAEHRKELPCASTILQFNHLQNSNTAVKVMLEAAGLRVILPVDDQGREVFAPGIESTFKHTIVDKTLDSYEEFIGLVSKSFNQGEELVINDLSRNPTKSPLSKKAKHCKEKIEKAIHNMEQSRLIKTLCEVKLKANEVGSCTPEIYGHLAKVWVKERVEKIYKNPMSAGPLDGEVTKLIDCYEHVEYLV